MNERFSAEQNTEASSKKTNVIEKYLTLFRKYLAKFQNKISASPYSYLSFCFIVPVTVMYLLYMTMGIHPFGDGSVLVLDLNGQYVYFFEALRNIVTGDGSYLYSFLRGLGGEFLGMYAYYLASPLSYIVVLFPAARILEALLTIILIKVGLCGLTFGFYLHKNSKNHNKVLSVAFSVMYALCAYAVIYQSNMMWIDALIWLPLITYGVEQLVKNGKYKLFVISLVLGIMSNYYIGYMLCIYVALYYFYYCFAHSKEELNPRGIRFNLPRSFLRIAFFSLIAVAISAFIIMAAYYSLTFGKTDFSNPDWSFKTKFKLIDFLTKFLPGAYDTVRPEGLPQVYCGILPLMLLPVYFLTKKIAAREKIASLIFIAIFCFSFIVKPLDLIWHGFQSPNWLNYRYSFMLSFFILVLAYKGFGNLRSVSDKFILGISAFIILFATVCNKLEFSSYVESNGMLLELETVWLTVIAAITFAVLLGLYMRQKSARKRDSIAGIIAVVVCIEIFCSSIACIVQYDADVAYSAYSKYNNFIGGLRPVVAELKENDDGFYRAEKISHKKYNDNMALGLQGLSGSTSTLNVETIRFLREMGYASTSHHSQYYGGNPVNDSLLGVKYIIDSNNTKKHISTYTPYVTAGDYTAYYNPYALSIAYGVDDSVSEFDPENYSKSYEHYFTRLNDMVSVMLGDKFDKDIFVPIDNKDVTALPKGTSSGSTVKFTVDNDEYVTYSFTAEETAEYYFYAPIKRTAEVKIYVYGYNENTHEYEYNYVGKYLGSNSKYIFSLGHYNAGENVSVRLEMIEKDLEIYKNYSYFWYIDDAAFKEAFSMLKANPQFEVEEYTQDNLKGAITTENASQIIQTTIPYDEGWSVYVDGERVETFKTFKALMAFEIEAAGAHTLEFKYEPSVYKTGAIISIIGIFLLVLLCALDIIFYFKIVKKKRRETPDRQDSLWVLDDFDEDREAISSEPIPEKVSLKEKLEQLKTVFKPKDKNENNDDSSEGES